MVFLQTSCSKEESQQQGSKPVQKSAPVELSRTHAEVLNFTEQYGLYVSGGLYEYPTLTLDDAEWILEAAFNYTHSLQNPSEVEGLVISYEEADPITFEGSEYDNSMTLNHTTLFGVYDQLLTQSSSIHLAPLSDFEIEPIDAGNAKIVSRYALLAPDPIYDYLTRWPYDDYQRSYEITGNIKNRHWGNHAPSCGGNVSSKWSWQQLTHNLRATHVPPLWVSASNNLPYFHTLTTYTYGEDPFDPSEYVGPANQNYSLDIYGASPLTVNSASFADGDYAQCISKLQMQDFEAGMDDILADHIVLTPNSEASFVDVAANDALNPNPVNGNYWWSHHIFTFTVGIKNP